MTIATLKPLAPHRAEEALDYVRKGGRLFVRTYTQVTVIDSGVVRSFDKVGAWLLREEGEGYRLRSGRKSVYLLPGQLEIETYSD